MKKTTKRLAAFVSLMVLMTMLVPLFTGLGTQAGAAPVHSSAAPSTAILSCPVRILVGDTAYQLSQQNAFSISDEKIPLSGPEEQAETLVEAPEIQSETPADEPEPATFEAALELPADEPTPAVISEPASEPALEATVTPESTQEADIEPPAQSTHDAEPIQPITEEAPAVSQEPTPEEEPAPQAQEPIVEHVVLYVDGENLLMQTLLVPDGEALEQPLAVPVLEGHTFLYWYNIDTGLTPYTFGTPVHQSMTLKPLFELDPVEPAPEQDIPQDDTAEPETAPEQPIEEAGQDTASQSEHDVIGIIKGDDGLEVLIVKDPSETEAEPESPEPAPETEAEGTDPEANPEAEAEDTDPEADPEAEAEDTDPEADPEAEAEDTDPEADPETEAEDTDPEADPDTETEDTDPEADPGEAETLEEVPAAEPTVETQFAYTTDDETGALVPGSIITVTAILSGFPEDAQLLYQWQNNASGEYLDVPGATGLSYAFEATEANTGCSWRLNVTVVEAQDPAEETGGAAAAS